MSTQIIENIQTLLELKALGILTAASTPVQPLGNQVGCAPIYSAEYDWSYGDQLDKCGKRVYTITDTVIDANK